MPLGMWPSLPFDSPQRFLYYSPVHHSPSVLPTLCFRLICYRAHTTTPLAIARLLNRLAYHAIGPR
jgi:hypothetical protein